MRRVVNDAAQHEMAIYPPIPHSDTYCIKYTKVDLKHKCTSTSKNQKWLYEKKENNIAWFSSKLLRKSWLQRYLFAIVLSHYRT